MKLIYNFSMILSEWLMPILSLISSKIRAFWTGRKSLFQNLIEFREKNKQPLAWFHVASLGEYEQAKPVIEALILKRSDLQVVVSFFSPSGYIPIQKKKPKELVYITYLPLDTPANARKFVNLMAPEIVFFVKYDLWNNVLYEVKRHGIPLYLIAASFREGQPYFRQKGFFRNQIFYFDHIFTQNTRSLSLLDKIGYTAHTLAGDTRFDRVSQTAEFAASFPDLEKWKAEDPVIVLGSVWQEDMEILIPLINQKRGYKWIIAPHSLDPKPMRSWRGRLEGDCEFYSEWDKQDPCEILFIDNVGMLSSLYQFARVAYVGGGFGKGLHNILEPLGFHVPVFFGKLANSRKFPEAKISQEKGCGFEVASFAELVAQFERLEESKHYHAAVKSAEMWVTENTGAAARIIGKLTKLEKKL
ncbi:MAG: 3-deoxy-D-manno-octulosonic acid transferase [Bacteroidota bacterium]